MTGKELGPESAPGRVDPRYAAFAVFAAAVTCVIALHLATSATLGFHTDELYYMDSGRHPALGYVDFPPIVPLLARLETQLLGVSPWTLRLLPSLLGGFLVALCGAYVRRLGGSLQVQGIALIMGIAAPFLLGSNWVFQTVTFDQVTWMISLYWFLCVVVDRRPRYWIYLGVTLGIGLEVKYTIIGLILGMGLAVLLTPALRAQLRTRYPWICAAIALLIWAPNLAWQATAGFPTVTYLGNHRGSGGGPAVYLLEFGVYLFFLIPAWLTGMLSLFRSRHLRPIGIACAAPLLLFLFVGKSYYGVGTIAITVAVGLMVISGVKRRKLRSGLEVAVVLASVVEFAVFAQLLIPFTPPDRIHAAGLDAKNEVFADSVGWSDIASQVTTIHHDLPASSRDATVVISAYYGVPGALHVYGDPRLAPEAFSPQLSGFYWLPAHLAATDALMVDYRPSDIAWMCTAPVLVAHLTVPFHVAGLEQGAPVTLCHLKAPIPQVWARLRNFS